LNSTPRSRSSFCRNAAAVLAAAATVAAAGNAFGFAGIVSPPRFELKAKPGEVVREILEIGNDQTLADEFAVSTADWYLNEKGGVEFRDSLDANSCRPWVRIERRTVTMQPRAVRKFRFEVHIPPDAPPGECRFAIVIEKAADTLPEINTGTIQFPLQGRIGVIVYVAVGDVAPKLELESVGLRDFNGHLTPSATLRNVGNAHGRPDGLLEGKDSAGHSFEFIVSPFPILPGETRSVALWTQEETGQKLPEVVFPLRIRGRIEWDGGRQDVDITLTPPPAAAAPPAPTPTASPAPAPAAPTPAPVKAGS